MPDSKLDSIAERATALGGLALGTARLAALASSLDEYPLDAVAGNDIVAVIADRLAAFGSAIRAAIDASSELSDANTADLFTEVSRASTCSHSPGQPQASTCAPWWGGLLG